MNKIYTFKAGNKCVNFPTQFCLGGISNKFDNAESEEVSLKANFYDFLVLYNAIDKSDISNIPKYFMVKNSIQVPIKLLSF